MPYLGKPVLKYGYRLMCVMRRSVPTILCGLYWIDVLM
jgi:hypothetical protein